MHHWIVHGKVDFPKFPPDVTFGGVHSTTFAPNLRHEFKNVSNGGGVHLTLVSKCALVYIYRSAIPLHVAVKLICFTLGLLIYIYIYIYIHVAVKLICFTIGLLSHSTTSSSKTYLLHNRSFDIT